MAKKTKKKVRKIRRVSSRTKRKTSLTARSNGPRYTLNPEFEFFDELKSLVLKPSPTEKDEMAKRISSIGRVRLAIMSGIFVSDGRDPMSQDMESDLFIVADEINKAKLRLFLKALEADIGKEIKFTLMEKDEFDYRYSMFDRFIRVLLESPHEKIINKVGL